MSIRRSMTVVLLAVLAIGVPCCFEPALAGEALEAESLILRVGGSKVFDAKNIANVDQPARNVASTKLVDDPPQLIVTGEKVGQATMILWLREPKGERKTVLIDVVQQLPTEIEKEIASILQAEARFAPVKTKVFGAKVLLFNIPDKSAHEHLERALKVYEGQVVLLPPGPPDLAKQLRALLAEWPDIEVVEGSPSLIVARGTCLPRSEPRVRALLKQMGDNPYGIKVIDIVEPERARKQIELRFGFAEMKNEDVLKLGVNWSDQIQLTLNGALNYETNNLARPDGTTSTSPWHRVVGVFTGGGGVTSFAILIDIADVSTIGKTHDEYTVVVSDGAQAQYDRKGTIYTEVQGVNTAELKEVDYGTIVKVTPELLDSGKVELTIEMDVSSIVPAASSGQDLTVQRNTTKQKVQVELEKSLVLWHALQHLDKKTMDAVSGLGKIPALGCFFKSRDFQDTKSEAVIWIEPRLTTTQDKRNLHMKDLISRLRDGQL